MKTNSNQIFATGTITEDPAIACNNGQELNFIPLAIQHDFKSEAIQLKNWESFEGALIKIHFSNGKTHSVDGSGVIIAPGVAISAYHVIKPHLADIASGAIAPLCTAITSWGLSIWKIEKITPVPNSDLVILSLYYSTKLPPDNHFNQANISTRLPQIGENLLVAGFKSSQLNYLIIDSRRIEVSGNVLACNGKVTQKYPCGRDSAMLPWPTLEVNCPSWGGMSGGPVFDSKGLLVGLLSSSFDMDGGPSYVSLIWPALAIPFEGGWPRALFQAKRTLLDMSPTFCAIDKTDAIEIEENLESGDRKIRYSAW